jgi:hypothetical protein
MSDFLSGEKNNTVRVFKEATIVGILTVITAHIIKYIVKPYFKVDLPEICEKWNKKHVFEVSMFLTGFVLHIVLEISGANKTYALYRSKI